MAWLVSVKLHTFSAPPPVLASQRELLPSMPAQCVLSSLRTKRIAVNILLYGSISKHTTTLNQDSWHVAVSPWQLFTPVSKLSHVSYRPRILTGYWVGPDTEDGWGFAEAFIEEIL